MPGSSPSADRLAECARLDQLCFLAYLIDGTVICLALDELIPCEFRFFGHLAEDLYVLKSLDHSKPMVFSYSRAGDLYPVSLIIGKSLPGIINQGSTPAKESLVVLCICLFSAIVDSEDRNINHISI